MFETTTVISRKRHWRIRFWCTLPASIAVHLSVLTAITVVQAWDVSFPVSPPQVVGPYRLLVTLPLPPRPPPPPPTTTVARTGPVAKPGDDVAPNAIPDGIPDLLPVSGIESEGADGGVEGGVAGGESGGVIGGVEGSVAPLEPSPRGGTVVVARDTTLPLTEVWKPYPLYPHKWRKLGVEDSLVIRYRIDRNGRVIETIVLVPPEHREFADESLAAIRTWRFEPFLVDGEPVEVVHELTVNFRFERSGG
jgi:protein TonB